MSSTEALFSEIKEEEGTVKKNGLHIPYRDHLGYETIGWGILIDPSIGGGLRDEEAEFITRNRIRITTASLEGKLDFWDSLTPARSNALVNMAYQMGVPRFMKFKKMIEALRVGNYDRAYIEALDSLWAKQTPDRALRVAKIIKSG